ncbi:MAG: NAD(P)H-binding protein [Vicinamibacteria bacterium]
MITVMGASGHTGLRLTELLLESGEKVRALGRSAEKLQPLASLGAETRSGDGEDARFLASAFRGADGVFTLLPPDVQSSDYLAQQDRMGEAIVDAIRESGVRRVVFLSSIGADLPSGTGPIAGLHAQEERLRRIQGADVLLLRPAYFFENFYLTLDLIKHQGVNGGAIAPELVMPMIATRDVAGVAAQALRGRDFQGVVVRELHGPRDLSHAEATRILGARIGKPDLKYAQFPYDDFVKGLVQMGVSENVANLYAEMDRSLNEGKVKPIEGRRPENTTPTAFEDFASELERAYRS